MNNKKKNDTDSNQYMSKQEFLVLKKEVTELRATVNFFMGYMSAKDPNFIYYPKSDRH